jgi:arylsulfatase A-like enzyme
MPGCLSSLTDACLGYHGSEFATPVIDDLAAKGVRLEQYYT